VAVIAVRRYQCRRCGGTTTVVPRGVVRRRLFTAAAIGLALCLFGLVRLCAARVREQVSPWRSIGAAAIVGWAQLDRWTDAVRDGRLFPEVLRGPREAGRRRDVAQRAAVALSARCPPQQWGLSMPEQVFVGAQAP